MNPRLTLFAVFLSFWVIVNGTNADDETNNNLEPETKPEIPKFCECVASDECKKTDRIDSVEMGFEETCGSHLVCCLFPPKNSFDSDSHTPLSTSNSTLSNATHQPTNLPTTTSTPFQPPISISDMSSCGIRQTVTFGEFPWMGLIFSSTIDLKSNKNIILFRCGASLITPTIILTAAHCVAKLEINSLRIRIGEYDTKSNSEISPYQEREVKLMEVHPDYNAKFLYNDLALLVVEKPFELQQSIAPVCLPLMSANASRHDHEYDPNSCLVMGWGGNNYPIKPYTKIARKANVSLVPSTECEFYMETNESTSDRKLPNSFICAVGEPEVDVCMSDQGGSLVCQSRRNSNQYIQVGVASRQAECKENFPGLYASLEANEKWLASQLLKRMMSNGAA